MAGATYRYFARGNTALGDHSLYASALQGLGTIYRLQGFPGMGKSTLLQRLSAFASGRGLDVQEFHSAINPGELDALIVTDLKIGFVDERACGDVDLTGTRTVEVDLRQALNEDRIAGMEPSELAAINDRLEEALSNAYAAFAAALRVHDEWESFYIESMDFRKANELTRSLSESVFGGRTKQGRASVRHLFLGAATPVGAIDYIMNLTDGLNRRIFMKGRPGSGKSTLLKRLAAESEKRGFNVDVFHCGFDPNSLDMLIFPELDLALFDSTAPHEHFPNRDGDTVLDMYAELIAPGIDERYAKELYGIKQRYAAKMQEATAHLAEARACDAQIKAVYTAATDFSAIDRLGGELEQAIARD